MKQNASVYVKTIKGKDYLYIDIKLNNGELVTLPIKQSFYNAKLDYKIKKNIERKN